MDSERIRLETFAEHRHQAATYNSSSVYVWIEIWAIRKENRSWIEKDSRLVSNRFPRS